MSTDAAIRPAEAADMPSVAAIYAHYVADSVATFDEIAPSAPDWVSKLADVRAGGWPFLVAATAQDVLGYAFVKPFHVRPAYRYTVENSIYLHPAHVGAGLGRKLLRDLLDATAAAGAREVVAVIADTGTGASISLHTSLGFRFAGTLTGLGYKQARWIDISYLQCSLPDHPYASG